MSRTSAGMTIAQARGAVRVRCAARAVGRRHVAAIMLTPLLALALALDAGCAAPRPATQVVVTVVAEPGVTAEMRSLVVRVRGAAIGSPLLETYARTYRVADMGGVPAPLTLAVAPAGGDVTRIFEAEAEAVDAVGDTVAIARARGAFQPGRTLEIRLLLSDRCRGVACPSGQTCDQGRCVPADVDPTDRDGGVPDGGVIGDGGVPIGGECESDSACDDGVYCNGAETCEGRRCVGGARETCDDGVDCTEDLCVGSGCVHTSKDGLCTGGSDGRCDVRDGCQYSVCDATTCRSTGCVSATCEAPPSSRCVRTATCAADQTCCGEMCVAAGCDDGNSCTRDLCGTSGCVHEPQSLVGCSDGDACTDADVCRDGTCSSATRVVCDDGNPCTTDSCDRVGGCRTMPVAAGTSCADLDLCDGTEMCLSGACAPGTPLTCDDGIACTRDACGASGCTSVPDDTLCTAGASGRCEVALGGCQYTTCTAATCVAGPCETAMCVGGACQRTPTCSPAAMCCAGMCVTMGCSDGNPCTSDSCGATGCVSTPAPGPCEDGSACTSGDTCSGGACVPGPGCSDGNQCTDDVCGAGGTCTFPQRTGPCDDGNGCTTLDRCTAGACVPGGMMFCGDFNECTADSCVSGACVNEPVSGLFCTPSNPCARDGMCDGSGNCIEGMIDLCCIMGSC